MWWADRRRRVSSTYCQRVSTAKRPFSVRNPLWSPPKHKPKPRLCVQLKQDVAAGVCGLRAGVDVGLSRIHYAQLRIYLHNWQLSAPLQLALHPSLSLSLSLLLGNLQLQLLLLPTRRNNHRSALCLWQSTAKSGHY